MSDRTWTIIDVIRWTTNYFQEKAIDSPRATAEILLARVLKLERIQLYLKYDKPLHSGELAEYRNGIKRRVAGEPLQYITGVQEFWSHTFRITPAVLIPRPETELLVEEGLKLMGDAPRARALEIGVGAGAIALSLASEIPDLLIIATDVSTEALSIAKINRGRMKLSDRVLLFACDLFSALSEDAKFNLIISNPPYVSEKEYQELPREIKEHEPAYALLGGVDGLDIIKVILKEAVKRLQPRGYVLLEIGSSQGKAALEFARDLGLYQDIAILRDYAGRERVFKGRTPG